VSVDCHISSEYPAETWVVAFSAAKLKSSSPILKNCILYVEENEASFRTIKGLLEGIVFGANECWGDVLWLRLNLLISYSIPSHAASQFQRAAKMTLVFP
jgi:hypothetical protein